MNRKQFQVLRNTTRFKIIVVDLRQEPHVFMGEKSTTLYSYNFKETINLDEKGTMAIEHKLIRDLKKNYRNLSSRKRLSRPEILQNLEVRHNLETQKNIEISNNLDLQKNIAIDHNLEIEKHPQTEAQTLKKLNIQYKRFAVTDHQFPNNRIVDQFVLWFKNIKGPIWIHIHCRAGKGRTTTFMTMISMLTLGDQRSFEEHLNYQYKIGGSDLHPKNSKDPYLKQCFLERFQKLHLFYEYSKDGYKKGQTFSDWQNRKAFKK